MATYFLNLRRYRYSLFILINFKMDIEVDSIIINQKNAVEEYNSVVFKYGTFEQFKTATGAIPRIRNLSLMIQLPDNDSRERADALENIALLMENTSDKIKINLPWFETRKKYYLDFGNREIILQPTLRLLSCEFTSFQRLNWTNRQVQLTLSFISMRIINPAPMGPLFQIRHDSYDIHCVKPHSFDQPWRNMIIICNVKEEIRRIVCRLNDINSAMVYTTNMLSKTYMDPELKFISDGSYWDSGIYNETAQQELKEQIYGKANNWIEVRAIINAYILKINRDHVQLLIKMQLLTERLAKLTK